MNGEKYKGKGFKKLITKIERRYPRIKIYKKEVTEPKIIIHLRVVIRELNQLTLSISQVIMQGFGHAYLPLWL